MLTRERVEKMFSKAREYGGTGLDDYFPALLAHDAALRSRVDALETVLVNLLNATNQRSIASDEAWTILGKEDR